MWPFNQRRYDDAAEIVGPEIAFSEFSHFNPYFDFKDGEYLLMSERNLRDFVWKYWDIMDIKYHGNSEQFPDCDDFARIVFGRILAGAIKEKFKRAPLLGVVDLRIGGGTPHEQIWAIVKGPTPLLFEPQRGTWQGILRLDSIRMISA